MKDPKTQRWHHVDIKVARDKVGNALRDAIKQRQEGKSSTMLDHLNNPCASQVPRDPMASWTNTASSRTTRELRDDPTSCVDEQLARLPVVHSHNNLLLPTPRRVEPGGVAVPTDNMFLYPRHVKEQDLEQPPQVLSAYNIMNQAHNGGHANHQLVRLPLDQSFFSLTPTMEPQIASDGIHGVLAHNTFNLPRNLLPFEALVDSMDVDEFDDFEPRPIGAMFSV